MWRYSHFIQGQRPRPSQTKLMCAGSNNPHLLMNIVRDNQQLYPGTGEGKSLGELSEV